MAPAMEEIPSAGAIALPTVQRFVDLATDALGSAREEIDALNVYPVPDGDTGTNLHLTVSAARDALADAAGQGREAALSAFVRGALLGARGNSGVIVAEMLGAVARRIGTARPDETNAAVMADALHRAARAGYAAVGTPVEGTMLTVALAAGEAAVARLDGEPGDPPTGRRVRARDVLSAAAEAARVALEHTPEQLPALARAGVVDAGGRGICVLLDAAETALTGRRPPPVRRIPVPLAPQPAPVAGGDLTEDGPAYEVMYLLEATDERVRTLRDRLGGLGDSLVVSGGDGLWNVHVHVDDVGAALEAGIEAGRPHRVRVTHFAEQVDQAGSGRNRAGTVARTGRAVVAVAAGAGLAELFTDAGAHVVAAGRDAGPSTAAMLAAITGTGAAEVVVLPNDGDAVRAARVAAEMAESDDGIRVAVIETVAQVQGLAALAVHEPGRAFERDVQEMTATASHVRHGAVTMAAQRAMTMAGPCEPGDVLGVVAGEFVVVGQDLATVVGDVLDRLLAGGGELVTLVSGAGGEGLAEPVAARVRAQHPFLDVTLHDGGQERYPLLLCVE